MVMMMLLMTREEVSEGQASTNLAEKTIANRVLHARGNMSVTREEHDHNPSVGA